VAGGGFGWQVADTLAHELGHNFGNWHTAQYDEWGNKTLEYSNALDPLHGPLMGTNTLSPINKWTTWHGSANAAWLPDPAFLLDDMATIATDLDNYGGDGYRPDDFGGTTATAHPLDVSGVTQSHVGIIERLTDADAFSFTSSGGRYSIVAGRDVPSGVDLKLSIYNSSGTRLATEDGDPRAQPYTMVNDQHLTLDLPSGTYYAILESHGNYGDQGQYVLRVDQMASAWTAEDIGMVGLPGYSSYDAATGTYTVAGSGGDIWGDNDGFHYLYQTLSGNGSITAKVISQEYTYDWAKAGVMIRETLDANSKSAVMEITPSGATFSQYHLSTSATTSVYYQGPNVPHPYWVRLTRVGDVFTSYISPNNLTWTQVGSPTTVSMNSLVYIGLVTSAVNNTMVNASTFSNVALTGTLNPGPALNALAAPALSSSAVTSSSITLAWNDVSGETGYSIERSSDNINFRQVGTTAIDIITYTDNGLSDAQRYYYRVRTQGSGGTVSSPSNVANAITRAGAVTNLKIISYTTSQLVLDWTDASGETGYRVERSPNGIGNWTTVATPGKNVPLSANGGLASNTQYYYRVVTLDGSGDAPPRPSCPDIRGWRRSPAWLSPAKLPTKSLSPGIRGPARRAIASSVPPTARPFLRWPPA
jgi:regulation of enolase protein 1 (concanavalin A-like superfamily)